MMKTEKCIAKKTISVFRFAVMVGMVGFTQIAYSATASGPMTVSATVSSSCVVGTSTLAFGSATSAAITAGNVDATGTVTVNCTSGSTYSVALDAGAGTGATIAIRKMAAVPQPLPIRFILTREEQRSGVMARSPAFPSLEPAQEPCRASPLMVGFLQDRM